MSNYYATQRPDRGYQFYGSFEGLTEAMAHFGITPDTPGEVYWWSDEDCGDGPGWGPRPEWSARPEWNFMGDSNLGVRLGSISFAPLQAWMRWDGAVIVYKSCEQWHDPRKFVALEAPGLETYPSLQAAGEKHEFVRRIIAASAPAPEEPEENNQSAERPGN